jgi:Ca2+-binding RTX toxin-like protein
MEMSSKAAVFGTSGNNDIRATNDVDGTYLAGNGGDDTLRGGRYNDVLVGGEGDDNMSGGSGADAFVFYGDNAALSYQRPGGVPFVDNQEDETDAPDYADVDRIFDLTFAEGDKIVIRDYSEASANAVLRSWEDIVDLVDASGWEASRQAAGNNNLVISYDFGDGISQSIVISNGWSNYVEASGSLEIAS